MRAVLLAAGRGTRISRFIGDYPKCTLDIGGIELIRNTIIMLKNNNIKVSVVLGFNDKEVLRALKGIEVEYFYNPFFDVTNSIASLWFASEYLKYDDDYIIANADVFWEQNILDRLLNTNYPNVLLMDSSRNQDYLFKVNGNILIDYGKNIKEYDGEYIGVALLRKTYKEKFLQKMFELIKNQKHDLWWENVLYELSSNEKIYVEDIVGNFWSEIDYIEDYERILKFRNISK